MGNRIQRFFNKLGLFKKRPRLYVISKTGRLKEMYKQIHRKENKLVFTKDAVKGVTENIDIDSQPLKDDATEQYVFFQYEGETKTFDLLHQKKERSEADDLSLGDSFERGREFERTYQEERVQDKKIIYLFIVVILVNLAVLILLWQLLGAVQT